MYASAPTTAPLTQGDIVDRCPMYKAAFIHGNLKDEPFRALGQAVVLTQACDIAQSKADEILVAAVHPAQALVDAGILKGATVRDHVRRHLVYGWYFLPASGPPINFPESLVDLRGLHSVPLDLLQHLAAAGHRLCRIVTPWREHLAQPFAVTYSRIALPEPYPTQA